MTGWLLRDVDDAAAEALARALGVHPVTARCLAGRGIREAGEARSYLDPRLAGLRPPEGLAGLEETVARLARAVVGGERVGLFGDYDVDGVTTCALMATFLRELGVPCEARVATRDAGYGFGLGDARFFAERGCSLVVTGDCGTSDIASILHARELGMDVVVIDHHTVPPSDPDAPHPANALLNPLRVDSTFPFRGMASVGLAFYTMAALKTRLQRDGFLGGAGSGPDLRDLVDLVAIGTIADLVPLTGENRILTRQGLRKLEGPLRPGLGALLRMAGKSGPIDERAIGWTIAPRLNAPGRLGDAQPSLDLLLASDEREAAVAAEVVERKNQERRVAQDRVLEEALAALGDRDPGPVVVVAGPGWASGVVGIVAARLVDVYHRPAFVIALDEESGEGRGSARSPEGVNLFQALEGCRDVLTRFGGHAGAAGLTLPAGEVTRFRALVCGAVEAQLAGDRPGGEGAAVALEGSAPHRAPGADAAPGLRQAEHQAALQIDAEVDFREVDLGLAGELAALAPFGRGNEEPLLGSRVRVRRSRRVGDGSHLELHLEEPGDTAGDPRRAIAFGQGDRDPGAGAVIDAAFVPGVDHWRGNRRLSLQVRRFAPA